MPNCLKSQLYASENWELPFRETVPFTERLRHRVPWACFCKNRGYTFFDFVSALPLKPLV